MESMACPTGLRGPSRPAICGAQNGSIIADGGPSVGVHERDSEEIMGSPAGLGRPRLSSIGCSENRATDADRDESRWFRRSQGEKIVPLRLRVLPIPARLRQRTGSYPLQCPAEPTASKGSSWLLANSWPTPGVRLVYKSDALQVTHPPIPLSRRMVLADPSALGPRTATSSRLSSHAAGASGRYFLTRPLVFSLPRSSRIKMAAAVSCLVIDPSRNFVEGELGICRSAFANP